MGRRLLLARTLYLALKVRVMSSSWTLEIFRIHNYYIQSKHRPYVNIRIAKSAQDLIWEAGNTISYSSSVYKLFNLVKGLR